MKDRYDRSLQFAESLGYKNVAEAIFKMGAFEFRSLFKNFTPQPTPQKRIRRLKSAPKPKKVVKKIKVLKKEKPLRKTKVEKPKIVIKESFFENAKDIAWDNNYLIFNDGKVYSKKYRKFLKGNVRVSKNTKHLVYQLGKNKHYSAARLVYFHFCEHNKTNIKDLDLITTKDKNTLNNHYTNLEEISKQNIFKHHNVTGQPKTPEQKEKLAKIDKEFSTIIQKMIDGNISKNKIAEVFGTSNTSLNRFIKRHNLKV